MPTRSSDLNRQAGTLLLAKVFPSLLQYVMLEIFEVPSEQRLEPDTPMDIVRIIIAILLPPLGVFLQVGFGGHFWLNILLTLFGYIPGIIHAIWVIMKY